jgi:glycosyltransferase involved in cell wall biosynthesis
MSEGRLPRRGSVDVLVPCRNYGRFLPACVASALHGAERPVRVIILDDASTDDTPRVAAQLAKRYDAVVSVRHDRNIGHIATYNAGIAMTRADYMVLLSADDLLAPHALERAASVLDLEPGVGLVYGRTLMFSGEPAPNADPGSGAVRVMSGREFIDATFAYARNPMACPASVMVRAGLQQQIGGYLPSLPHAGDLEMYLRFAAVGDVAEIDAIQGLYRKHGVNMSRSYEGLGDYAQRVAAFDAICSDSPVPLPDREGLRRVARRVMAQSLIDETVDAFDRGTLPEASIDEQLRYASAIDPGLRRTRVWWSMRVKRALGRQRAQRVASILDRVRRSVAG